MDEHNLHNTQDHSQHPSQEANDHTQHSAMDHSLHDVKDHSVHDEHQAHTTPAQTAMGYEDQSTHASHGTDHSGHEQMFRVRF